MQAAISICAASARVPRRTPEEVFGFFMVNPV
jgi:hypothetical protein